MSDLNGVVGYARRWVELHRENKYQREAAKIIQRVVDALEAAEAERDAALTRIAELEKSYRIIERLYKIERQERIAAEARIAEAAKLHHKDHTALGNPICNTCGTPYPCPTRRRLGLNEGELA